MRHVTITLLAVMLSAGVCGAQDRTRKPPPKPATQEEVQSLRDAVEELRKQVASLRAEVAELARSLVSQPDDEPKTPPIRGDELSIGMTLDQVNKLTRHDGTKIEQNGNATRYKWVIPQGVQVIKGNKTGKFGTYTLIVDFEDGKVTRFRQFDNNDGSGGVQLR